MKIGQEKILLFTLAAVQFTNIMDFMIIMPLGPQLMRIFEISPKQFGLLVSSYTFSAGVSGLIAAFFIDRFDRKQALRVIYFGFTLGTIACALAPGYSALLITRSLTGIFGGIMGALILSIISDAIPYERRGHAMGIVMAAFSIASVFGVPFGLFLANHFGWNAPFMFLGGMGIIISIIIMFIIPSMRAHILETNIRPHPLRIFQTIFTNRNQVLALIFMMLLMFGQFSIIPFISPYMVANIGFTEFQLTYIYLIGGALSIVTSPVVGKLADRIGKLKVFIIFALIAVIPLFLITNLPPVAIPVALIVTSLFFICSGGRMIPASAMISATTKPQSRGSFMSINSSVQQLSAGIASFIAGSIVVKSSTGQLQNYQYVGYIAIAATIMTIFIARTLKATELAG